MAAGDRSTVNGCTFSRNATGGLNVGARCQVSGCTFASNNPANTTNLPALIIFGGGNRIDGNNFANNGFAGLKANAGGNLIIRNTFSGAQYIVIPGNMLGPTIDLTSGGTISSASGTTGTNPWANIMF